MERKIPKIFLNRRSGVTMVEFLIVSGILLLLFFVVLLSLNPLILNQRNRDNKRLSDIATLERAVNEFYVDTGSYPDSASVLRVSTSLPEGNLGPYEKISGGWIKADLSKYISELPIDPLNNSSYFYSYKHTNDGYEIDARLEINPDLSKTDGGNNQNVYEVGNKLTII